MASTLWLAMLLIALAADAEAQRKKRVAVMNFYYATVQRNVAAITEVDADSSVGPFNGRFGITRSKSCSSAFLLPSLHCRRRIVMSPGGSSMIFCANYTKSPVQVLFLSPTRVYRAILPAMENLPRRELGRLLKRQEIFDLGQAANEVQLCSA
jgi:hypothetical protein